MFRKLIVFFTFTHNLMAMDSLYTLDFSKLDEAKKVIETTHDLPMAKAFLDLISEKDRNPIEETYLEAKRVIVAREYARTFKQKGELPLWKAKSLEDILGIVRVYYANPENLDTPHDSQQTLDAFLKNFNVVIDELMTSVTKKVETYNEFVTTMGTIRKWKFEDYISCLLGIPTRYSDDGMAEKEKIFTLLKTSGFLRTDIRSVKKFKYDPTFPVLHFMENHPQTSNLVLGCGHHIHQDIVYDLNLPQESFCGCCNVTKFHLGDFTIALSAQDICDVIADMHDKRIWDILKTKPGGWKKIADHSWSESLNNPETLKHIYSALSPDGVFELLDIHPEEKIRETLIPIGFKLKGIDQENQLMFFVKSL